MPRLRQLQWMQPNFAYRFAVNDFINPLAIVSATFEQYTTLEAAGSLRTNLFPLTRQCKFDRICIYLDDILLATKLRLGFYDSNIYAYPTTLLWGGSEIDITGAGFSIIEQAISPILNLKAGIYHVAWQADNNLNLGAFKQAPATLFGYGYPNFGYEDKRAYAAFPSIFTPACINRSHYHFAIGLRFKGYL